MLKKILMCLLISALLLSTVSVLCAADDHTFEEVKNNAVVLYLNKSNVLVYGEKQYISDDHAVMPYRDHGSVMLPVAFFADTISAQVSMQGAEASLQKGDVTATFATVTGPGNAQYAKAEELCTAFSYYWHEETNGVVAYSLSNMEGIFDWIANLYPMRDMLEAFIYDDVSGEELYSLLLTNYADNQHPRLLITDEKMKTIREEIEKADGDEIYKKLAKQIVNEANGYLSVPVSVHELRDGLRLLYVCREAHDRIIACALAYQLTLDEKYAERAYAEMAAVSAFPDWNPYHFLDVGMMSAGVALGYDWLYNWMTPEQREPIREAVEKHVIKNVLRDMNGSGRRTYQWLKEGNVCNWRAVCGGGVGLSMLAMMDEFEGKTLEDAKKILPAMLEALRPNLLMFAPSGAYEEGYGYWGMTMQFYSYFMKSLEMITGSNYGYVDIPGLNMTSDYINALNGPTMMFNYHNAGRSSSYAPTQIMYLADVLNKPAEAAPVLDRIRSSANSTDAKIDILFYTPVMSQTTSASAKEDGYFEVSEVVTMRNGFKYEDVFVGFHCDQPYGVGSSGTEHMDAGMFQIQAEGVEWFLDLGSDDYNVSNLQGTYRFRAEGHNTVIFNPGSGFAMKKYGKAHISDYKFSSKVSYAVGEMTDAYRSQSGVESFLRGIKLDKETGIITVQDEIKLSQPAEMYWFAHTTANILVANDGKSATLIQNGKYLRAYIVSGEGATFSVMDAVPLPTSPEVPDQMPTDGIRKLTIHLEETDDIDLCVVFVASDAADDLSIDSYQHTAIAEWAAEVPEEEETTPPIDTDNDVSETDSDSTEQSGSVTDDESVIVIVCRVVIVLAVVAVAGMFLFNKKKKS